MEVTESVPSLVKIKTLVDWDLFPFEQKWIVYSIAELKYTWRKIVATWFAVKGEVLSFEALATCLMRSSVSIVQKKGENQDNVPYLCDADTKELDKEIRERAYLSKALSTISVLDEAAKLKVSRIKKGVEFLLLLKCDKLASLLEKERLPLLQEPG